VRTLLARRTALLIAVLVLILAAMAYKVNDLIGDLEREVDRSRRTDCELDNRASGRMHEFADEIARIMTIDGPSTPAGRRLVDELPTATEDLFPIVDCS
jgi:hypothetical protein